MLDRPIRDVVAVVFQHQSAFGYERHYDEGATCGWSGASANGRDWGGDVHLHIHCLNASGQRRRFTDYFGSIASSGPSIPAGGISSPIAAPSGQATPTAKEFDFTMPMPQDVRDYFDEQFKAATQDHANIGSNTDRRAESLKKTIQEEGALLKVLFNRASGIYSLASVGLKYWWELGQDINKATPQETWQARKEFGEGTLSIYRERGFAQTWVHELDEEEWNFYRMLCTNTPTNPSDENLAHLASVIAKQNTLLETIAAKIGVTGLA
ncbi:hypothetical protein [Rathayibacter sp. AY1B8]|uniref:hypothetical protein n=1 Tax=Rathayibacter sp. AY1B8 TaxID=2080533 RepID=UPI000CE72999|nr:hypothetical protein [Rathayibacter sp. AY1B8]PPI08240.1 hypothetical protein C5C63_04605 [Rathayibacter sp. AY1B8]